MSDKELKELVASLAVSQKEAGQQMSDLQKEVAAAQKETDKQIKQVNKQLGELGNKWGTFTEGMAIESIRRILLENFQIPTMFQRAAKKMNGESIEIDFFGYENSSVNTAVIVEVKSHLRDDSYKQIEETMKNFPRFFPDHADKKLYGIIACVHAPDSIRNVLRKKGIYLAVLHDDIFELCPFQNFTPKDYNPLS